MLGYEQDSSRKQDGAEGLPPEIPQEEKTTRQGIEQLKRVGFRFSDETYDQVVSRTKELAITDDHEFWVYILRNGDDEEKTVEIGIGHAHGLVANPEDVIDTVAPDIESGWRIVADYHNHPQTNVLAYRRLGLDETKANTPSITDIDNLKQDNFPRFIGVYLPTTGKVEIAGYKILRDVRIDEIDTVSIEEPAQSVAEKGYLEIKLIGSRYSKREPLIDLGVLSLIKLEN